MYGAIFGDIVGSVYEFHNIKTKDFPIVQKKMFFTDDSVMTLAVAKSMLKASEILYQSDSANGDSAKNSLNPKDTLYQSDSAIGDSARNALTSKDVLYQSNSAIGDSEKNMLNPSEVSFGNASSAEITEDFEKQFKKDLVQNMQDFGRRYAHRGYGSHFIQWIISANPKPYGSYGNGSAMRVSSAGYLFKDMKTTRKMAALSAEVTHNHPEGIKGAESVAAAIFLARTGRSKAEIKDYITSEFGYLLDKSLDSIRPGYDYDVTCMGTVPEAIISFLEGTSYEDVIRNAISIGGDSDTLACIAGSIAEAYYKIPYSFVQEVKERMTGELMCILNEFDSCRF